MIIYHISEKNSNHISSCHPVFFNEPVFCPDLYQQFDLMVSIMKQPVENNSSFCITVLNTFQPKVFDVSDGIILY